MSRDSPQFVVVIAFATVAGFLRGGLDATTADLVEAQLITEFELSIDAIGLLMSVLSLLALAATIGVFVTGYWWANRADIPAAYGRFAVWLCITAVAGYGLGFLPLSLLFTDQPILAVFAFLFTGAASLITIPITGLAGGAIAQYRSVTQSS
ncbi:hypothetical protein D8Y22_12910 [Salinadaptatus halalkaliphilus]|uniref:Uncharacterized protein n=1 Tax=Salinadaptatus halalkaliphilus TaxID=2419781 RepID=A0A4S3TK96_9EURY|nr:hypothetical protein [Salinadaptatus halalkaliphilus]THE64534.1 hypothetical protein D8Y22_12910 [Salinadaptatus halalkaliphilus]